ncbi:hypothetical protein BB559_003755 [Furculomyces boomerangus]|uniref:Uncharacterized protein n=1 Tax=Furculomyces boomerangus TaxID=61424 RepID=A0A2T9YJ26_9FUNG|nr:hypothetical protein BB559_003755 [Furculomyces boomerangus]
MPSYSDNRNVLYSKENGAHNHRNPKIALNVELKNKCSKIINENLFQSVGEKTNASKILLNSKEETSESIQEIPSYNSIKSSVYRMRSKILSSPPKTLTDININEEFRNFSDGRTFVLSDKLLTDGFITFGVPEFIK